MDLTPIQAQEFLKGLKTEDLRRIGMTDEDYQIVCARVAELRWRAEEDADKEVKLRHDFDRAVLYMRQCRRDADIAMLRHRTAVKGLNAARVEVNRLKQAMEGLDNG